tara:strand:+ start:231 stop:482 length:252 start_codon:yes stop_codon:yes gene_type:complete
MIKANKIYLERVRKNDWVDRSPESRIKLRPMTIEQAAKQIQLSFIGMRKAAEVLSRYQPKPNFPKGGIEFINPIKEHFTQQLK